MKKWIIAIAAIGLVFGIQAGTLITSDGAWDNTSVIALSNGGVQTNYNNSGGFNSAAGKDYFSSNANASETNTMYMAAVPGNPDLTYQAGKTYIYQIQGYAAIAGHSNTQNVMLIAGSDTNGVAGTLVSGLNNTGVYGVDDQVAISGSYTVETGDPIIGQSIGMKLYSSGIQTRWYSDGSSFVSSVLADHTATGTLFETEFELDGAGELITSANPIEMEVVDGESLINTASDSYFRMNINAAGAKNNFKLDAQADSFRASTIYTLSFRGQKTIEGDAAQNEVDIILGGTYTNTLSISTTTTPYSFAVDSDDIGLVGDDLSIEFVPSGVSTAAGVNQYRVFNIDFSAAAPPPVHTGLLYQTSFETNAAGVIAVNNINLEVVDGFNLIKEAADNYVALNLNSPSVNDFQLAAAADTFHALTTYTFSFDAEKKIENDASQNELGFILGGSYTNTVVVGTTRTSFSFDINAEDLGFDGETFSVEIEPLGTTTAVNQYRLYDLEITATDIPLNLTSNGTDYIWLDDYYAGLVSDEDYEAQDITDTDNDGFLAWQEYQLGTDPTNALSLLAITDAVPAAGGEFVVTWQSADGKSYNILTNVSLSFGDWGETASSVPAAGAETSYTTTVGSAVNFFQVELD